LLIKFRPTDKSPGEGLAGAAICTIGLVSDQRSPKSSRFQLLPTQLVPPRHNFPARHKTQFDEFWDVIKAREAIFRLVKGMNSPLDTRKWSREYVD
jgi:hypothetical protein